jgi:hypothetical protein
MNLRRATRRALGAACAAGVLAVAVTAGAQTAQAAAQALFDEAKGLTAAGKYAEACPKLVESQRLDPSIGTQFYLADCFEHEGKLASAWINYVEVADRAKLAGEPDREGFARKRAEALVGRLPKLVLTVPEALRPVPGLEVKFDGVVIGPAQWGTPVPVDPGRHALAAAAPGKRAWEGTVSVAGEAGTVTAAIPMLADAPPPVTPPPVRSAPPSRALRTTGLVIGGVGVACIGVGLGLGGVALSKKGQVGGHCDGADDCDPTGLSLRSSAIGAATASTGVFVAGAVLLGGGVVLLVATRPSAPATGLAVGPNGVSLGGSF